jgi:hypothetical protein
MPLSRMPLSRMPLHRIALTCMPLSGLNGMLYHLLVLLPPENGEDPIDSVAFSEIYKS